MAASETILYDITDLLKKHPRGLSVKEIADEIGMNRMSVARYLDVMRSSGRLDMIQFGHAKIYSISNRVPVAEILNYSSDFVMILNQNRRINYANTNFLKLIDKKEDEIKGKHIYDILSLLSDEYDIESVFSKIFEEEDLTDEINIVKGNKEYTFAAKIIHTVLVDGTPGVTIFLKDISEKNNFVGKLKTTERLYDSIVSKTSDLVIYTDSDGLITYANPRSFDILGYKPQNLTGRNISDFVDCKNNKFNDCFSYISFCIKSGEQISPVFFESEFKHSNGHHIILNVYICSEYIRSEKYCGYQILCSILPLDLKLSESVQGTLIAKSSCVNKNEEKLYYQKTNYLESTKSSEE